MSQALRRSRGLLGESCAAVAAYLRSQATAQGGFRDRAGRADLYYTVFGLEALHALDEETPPGVIGYLERFGDGAELDFVHLCCLIRCRAAVGLATGGTLGDALRARLDRSLAAETESAYGCFLSAMAYEDLRQPVPHRDNLVQRLLALRAADGGFANQPGQAVGLTPSTAATATLLPALGAEAPAGLSDWLLARRHPDSGFYAVPSAPIPDLLSTATALHALSCLQVPLDALREPCLDFLQSLWTGSGSFAGSWADSTPDCEYTYYGLLALGHLAE